jgi:hypothetical protein
MNDQRHGPPLRTQILRSGVTIRQDFRKACRFVFFDTGLEDWTYATHGGTAFVVNVEGKVYAITARHVLGDFAWSQIMITDEKFGRASAGICNVYSPSNPTGGAIGSDLMDVAFIEFTDDVTSQFFKYTAYIVDDGTAGRSHDGHELLVCGNLKDRSEITEDKLKPQFGLLQLLDEKAYEPDSALRCAIGKFDNDEITSATGLSGAPVFDSRISKLCGMVVRGSITDRFCRLYYIEAFDILKALEAVRQNRSSAAYQKGVMIRKE